MVKLLYSAHNLGAISIKELSKANLSWSHVWYPTTLFNTYIKFRGRREFVLCSIHPLEYQWQIITLKLWTVNKTSIFSTQIQIKNHNILLWSTIILLTLFTANRNPVQEKLYLRYWMRKVMFWKLQTIPQEYIPPCKVFLYFLHRSKE